MHICIRFKTNWQIKAKFGTDTLSIPYLKFGQVGTSKFHLLRSQNVLIDLTFPDSLLYFILVILFKNIFYFILSRIRSMRKLCDWSKKSMSSGYYQLLSIMCCGSRSDKKWCLGCCRLCSDVDWFRCTNYSSLIKKNNIKICFSQDRF